MDNPITPAPAPTLVPAPARSSRRPVRLAALLATGLLVGLVPSGGARAALAPTPTPGADGIGDPYFPLDGNGGIDVAHYEIHDSYDFDKAKLTGWTRLTVRATQDLSRFNLDLLLPVRKVKVDGVRAAYDKPTQHELEITPRSPIATGATFTVLVRYAGRPGPIEYAGEKNWLADDTEVVAMNQPHMAPWWFPANDHPLDKATMDVHITVPRAKKVISNGELVSRRVHGERATTRWRSTDAMVPYLAFFAAGPFQTAKGTYQGLPWYVAVSKQLAPHVRRTSMALMRKTPEITAWTATQLGAYPFDSTGGLTTALPVGFALENQTRPTYPVLTVDPEVTVAHEIAHQWFGDSVSIEGWRDIWLNEGAATFMEARYTETHGGESAAAWLTRTYDAYAPRAGFWTTQVDDPGASQIFSSPVYLRGGLTLQALRQRIGEDAFWTLLRTWVATRAGGNGDTAQFIALAEQVSGQDLDGFFQAWLRDPVPPARTTANGF